MGRRVEKRIAITIRLPYDTYREVVARAKKREWSLSHYIAHCIDGELVQRSRSSPDRTRIANLNLELLREADDNANVR